MRNCLLILAAIALLNGCSSKDRASASGAFGGTVIMDNPGEPTDALPPFVFEQFGRLVQDQVFERLADLKDHAVTVGDKGFAPRLARSWTWSRDSLSIAFSLDPRARWHDGKPVTAADVRYTFMVFTNPKVGSVVAPNITNIDSISIRDSLTPVVWFKKRTPEQFYDLAYQLVVMPQHVYGRIPPEQLHTSAAARILVGSGPFRFVKWEPGRRLELVADTANYRGRPTVDRLILTPVDPPTAAAQILTGQADFMEAFPSDQLPKLDNSTMARSNTEPIDAYTFMGMNPHALKSKTAPHPLFSDIRVRRALSMAVDRDGVLHNVFVNNGRLSHGPFPMTLGYADSTLRIPPFDTTAAKALLDSAGWVVGAGGARAKNGQPLRFSLLAPTSSLFRRRYGVLLQEQFRRIGAHVDLDMVDLPTMVERMHAGDFDAALHTAGPDPSITGAKQFWGTAAIGPNGDNLISYSNPKVDALLDSAAASFDAAYSKAAASRAFQTILDDVPAIWLYDVTYFNGINRRITVPVMTRNKWWMDIERWSIPADERIARDRIGLTPAKP